jgi:N-acetylmuramoyl-L-alanine amidase
MRALVSRAYVLCLCFVLGCETPAQPFEMVGDSALEAMPRASLERYAGELEEAMRHAGLGVEATESRMRGAALARVLARRLEDPVWLTKAHAWLSVAAADGSDETSRCAAVEALVKLERDDLADPESARETLRLARQASTDETCSGRLEALSVEVGFEGVRVTDTVPVSAVPGAGQAPRPLRVILLDPGHGGDEHGARVEGVRESNLALDITRRTALLLSRMLPETRILMTRESDVDITLEQRAAMAQGVNADLFVSVHLNAASEPVEHGGVTTFVLDSTGDEAALRLAARENGTATVDVTGMQRLIAGLHRAQQGVASQALAQIVHTSLLASARRHLPALPDRGVKSAMFYVLVGAEMPAILVEASFMTRPEELAELRTKRYRQALAEGIALGIVRYAHAH